MIRKVHCEKKTKIYIPKTINPQIISYKSPVENQINAKSADSVKKTI